MKSHRASRLRAGLIVANVVLAMLGGSVQPALAIMTGTETVAPTFTTTTLHPPTGLAAAAALLLRVNLTWTATTDPRATGYQILRGTANGGPYAQVATVTSAATATYQDSVPLPGVYYYVLRTYYDSWTSSNSNEAQLVAA